MRFSPEALFIALSEIGRSRDAAKESSAPPSLRPVSPQCYWLAFSGGLDSLVLLHALAALRERIAPTVLRVVHVNHGLHAQADDWAEQCARQCAELKLSFTLCTVNAKAAVGESPEAAARVARYQALSEWVGPDDCLLTAHHQDDQAETLLLQLLRGAGPKGLAAMPAVSAFSAGWHVRPLLGFRREDLRAYAEANGLSWLEDDSNADTGFDRNFLRHKIMPELRARFPAMASTLSRSARRCAEAAELLQGQAKTDLLSVQLSAHSLSVGKLQMLGEVRARNVLHHWVHACGLPLPSEAHLLRLWRDVLGAAVDAMPLLQWANVQVRRYRDGLFVMRALQDFDSSLSREWDCREPLRLSALGVLCATPVVGEGVAKVHLVDQVLLVRFRRGGEKICVLGREGHHSLKKLFQEAGVPPWQRARIPLLFLNGELVSVTGYWVHCEFAASADEPGIRFTIEATA